MKEEKFDELLENSELSEEESKSFQKEIKKNINKKVYGKSIKVFVIGICTCLILVFITNVILNVSHYSPNSGKDKVYVDDEVYEENGDSLFFHVLMEDYISIYFPGYQYMGYPFLDTNKGFSKYEIHYQIRKKFNYAISAMDNVGIIQYSNWKPNDGLIKIGNEFVSKESSIQPDEYFTNKQKLIEEIQKMPESSHLDMSITFNEKMKIEDFLNFKNKFNNTEFVHMVSLIHGSMNLGFSNIPLTDWGFYGNFKGEYPNILKYEENKKDYENRYMSMLKLMIDNEDFYRVVNSSYFQESVGLDLVKEEYNNVKEKGLSIAGTRVYASKEDAIKLLQEESSYYILINDAKFSYFEHK